MLARSAAKQLALLVGFLQVCLSTSSRTVGESCHANIDCQSGYYCNRNQKCDVRNELGAPCPAGDHEACWGTSTRCERGFCVEPHRLKTTTILQERRLQDNATDAPVNGTTPAPGNITTPAPSPSGNVTTPTPTAGNVTTAAPSAGNVTTLAPTGNVTDSDDDGTVVPTDGDNAPTPAPMGNVTLAPTDDGTGIVPNRTMAPSVWDGVIDMDNVTDAPAGSGNIFDRPDSSNGNVSTAPTVTPPDDNTTAPEPIPAEPEPTLPPTCMASDDCDSLEHFCSSIGICEELTCANWANHTPVGNTSYSEAPCTAEGAPDGTAFCGSDGMCYDYDCDNWYKFGPVAYTGYDPNNPVELVCEEYANGEEENLNSVTFGCRSWEPGKVAPKAKSVTYFFNMECLAKPRGNDEFKCYQNKKTTDYSDFQGAVARQNPGSCDRETYPDQEQPLYWYIIQLWQERKGNVTKYKHGRDNTLSGESFNANLAEKTMYAHLVSSDDAPEQPVVEEGTDGDDKGESGAVSRFIGPMAALCAITVSWCLL